MLGPFDVEFDARAVSDYLSEKPSADEKRCMNSFFDQIQISSVNIPYGVIGRFFVVDRCGFSIDFRYTSSDGSTVRVEGIRRSGIGRFRRI
jgi:hypothetical protein